MGPLDDRSRPAGWFRLGFHGCAPMMGAGVVVRNAECGRGFVDERAVFHPRDLVGHWLGI